MEQASTDRHCSDLPATISLLKGTKIEFLPQKHGECCLTDNSRPRLVTTSALFQAGILAPTPRPPNQLTRASGVRQMCPADCPRRNWL